MTSLSQTKPKKPIPPILAKKLLEEGWEGEMDFTAFTSTITLGGWLMTRVLKDLKKLPLLQECLRSGLPFFNLHDDKQYMDDLLSIAIERPSFHPQIWDVLFQEGLDINIRLPSGQTMLMLCCARAEKTLDKDELFQYFLSKNPDIHIKDHLGLTTLLRIASENPFSVPWFLKKGANAKDALVDTQSGQVYQNLFSFLLGSFWDDGDKTDPKKIEALLQVVLDAGADPHVIIEFDKTLLHCAYRWCPNAIPFFLNQGINLEHRDRDGKTILDLCQESSLRMREKEKDRAGFYDQCIQKIIEKMKEPYIHLPPSSQTSSPMKRI